MQQSKAASRRVTFSRALKLGVLALLKFCGAFYLARRHYRRHVRILCYHGAWAAEDGFAGDAMFIRPVTFEQRLLTLRNNNYNVISLEAAVSGLAGKTRLPPDAVVITIDDGWHSTFTDMLPALRRHGMTATIYCDTANLVSAKPVLHVMARYMVNIHGGCESRGPEFAGLVAAATDPNASTERKWQCLTELARILDIDLTPYLDNKIFSYMTPAQLAGAQHDGFAVELHTHRHSLHNFEPEKVEQEIELNRSVLSEMLGRPPQTFKHFCYPSGVTSESVQKIFERLGVRSATTLAAGFAAPGDNPLLLPRLIDGDHLTAIEFEANLCGVLGMLRALRDVVRSLLAPGLRPLPDARQSNAY
jgi:peptidoglycan/xylan/chitin deacetylase (PgdA/CDA1 family)